MLTRVVQMCVNEYNYTVLVIDDRDCILTIDRVVISACLVPQSDLVVVHMHEI